MKKSLTNLLFAIGACAALSAARAQTTNIIFGTDFETSGINDNYNYSYGYAFAGGNLGNAASGFAGSVTAGAGVTNGNAWDSMPDFTNTGSDPNYTNSSAYTYSGTEGFIQFSGPLNALTPSADLSSYVVSFDAKVQGLAPGINNTTLYFHELDFQTNGVTAVQFIGGSFTVSSNFTHFVVPLSTLTLNSGSISDLTNSDELATMSGLSADFRITDETGTVQVNRMPVWGFDNDNQLIIDNVYLTQTTGTVPPPLFERLIWQDNLDRSPPSDRYAFSFREGQNFATASQALNPTDGVGGSTALELTADISPWGTNPPTAFSGFGGGMGHNVPYTLHNTNKSAYRVYWTAKGGGFVDGVNQADANASIQFLVPPGTLTPSNANEAMILELAPRISLSSNYNAFVFDGASVPIGVFNGGSQSMFNQYISQVNLIQVQAQFNGGPDLGTAFGYDADNTMAMDDIKVVEIVQGIAPLSIVNSNGQIKVFWSDPLNGNGTAKLQSATNVTGPYVDVAGATSAAAGSPYTVPQGSSQHFFRAKWVSP
ncbi:MAG TPA: hypothetical protein VLT36_08160 [Candidatus Dormibacteraeota bacterium]|nr:hypothetical protein [Candidatus Dormibacteraeota bacterium]